MKNIIINKLNEHIEALQKDYDFFKENVYGYNDDHHIPTEKEEDRYFMSVDTVTITESNLSDLHLSVESYYKELNNIVESFDDEQCNELEEFVEFVDNMKDLVGEIEVITCDSDLSDYLRFDVNSDTMDIFDDNYAIQAVEDCLDEFMNMAQKTSYETLSDLFEENKGQLVYFNTLLKKLLDDYQTIKINL